MSVNVLVEVTGGASAECKVGKGKKQVVTEGFKRFELKEDSVLTVDRVSDWSRPEGTITISSAAKVVVVSDGYPDMELNNAAHTLYEDQHTVSVSKAPSK